MKPTQKQKIEFNSIAKEELERLVRIGVLSKGKNGTYKDSDYSKKIDKMKPREAFLEGLEKGKEDESHRILKIIKGLYKFRGRYYNCDELVEKIQQGDEK